MYTKLILTVMSDDKPGVVESIAQCAEKHQGNWLESRLAQLAGKFAGVVRLSIPVEQVPSLKQALTSLEAQGITIQVDIEADDSASVPSGQIANFIASGPDKIGIVKEISQALAQRHINLQSMESELSSMPYSGDPLFSCEGEITLPADLDIEDLNVALDEIADKLGLDFSLKTSE